MLLTGERKTTPQNQNVWFANVCHKTTHLSTELHHQAQATVFHWRMSSAICRQIPFRGRLRFHDIYLKRNCMKTAGVFSSVFRTGIHYIYIRYIDLPGLHPQLFHCGHQISIWHRCAISAKSHFTRRKRIKYVHMHVQVQNGSGKRTVRHCCNHVLRSLWADLPSMGQTSSLSWLDVCTRT